MKRHFNTESKTKGPSAFRTALKDQTGSALIAVLCVMMVIVTVCLSLLLAASVLSSAARRSCAEEQCRIMAESVSRKLGQELTAELYSQSPNGIPSGGSLHEYVGACICDRHQDWKDYDADGGPEHARSAVTRSFRLTDADWPSDAGTVTVSLYWVNGSGRKWDGRQSWESYFQSIDIDLYVEVTCTIQQESCTWTDIYSKVSNEEAHTWKWSQTERDGGGSGWQE